MWKEGTLNTYIVETTLFYSLVTFARSLDPQPTWSETNFHLIRVPGEVGDFSPFYLGRIRVRPFW